MPESPRTDWRLDPLVRLEKRLYPLQARLLLQLVRDPPGDAALAGDLRQTADALRDVQARYFDAADVRLPVDVLGGCLALARAFEGRAAELEAEGPLARDYASWCCDVFPKAIETLMDGLRGAFLAAVLARQEDARQQAADAAREVHAISRQIHFISINATIEAARVGEMGRGFAVIGDQIQTLSRETTVALDRLKETVQMRR